MTILVKWPRTEVSLNCTLTLTFAHIDALARVDGRHTSDRAWMISVAWPLRVMATIDAVVVTSAG